MLANMAKQKHTLPQPWGADLPLSNIFKVLSDTTRKDPMATSLTPNAQEKFIIDGVKYCANNLAILYIVSSTQHQSSERLLIDCSAYGGIDGINECAIELTHHKVDVHGIDN